MFSVLNKFTEFISLWKVNERRRKANVLVKALVLIAAIILGLPSLSLANSKDRLLIAQSLPTAPSFSPAYGLYTSNTWVSPAQNVSITAPSGSIFYTLDGSQPTSSSTPYTSSFLVGSNTQINAIAVVSGVASPVASAFYAFDTNAVLIPQTNLPLWLRADFGPILSSGFVTRWADISQSENDATSTSPNQPSLIDDAINDLPAVSFVSGTSGNFLSVPSGVSGFSAGASMFIVAKPKALTAGSQILSLGSSGSMDNAVTVSINSSGEPTLSVYDSSGSPTSASSSTAFSTTAFHLYEFVQSGTTATLFIDGKQVGQNTAMNSLPSGTMTGSFIGQSISGGNYFSGDIAEVMVYNTALSQSTRSALEAFLLHKYQLPQQPVPPLFSAASGTLPAPTQLVISAPANATVYYTTDGTNATTSSNLYNAPIDILYSQTVKAISVNGDQQSAETTASYVLDSTLFPAPASGGPAMQINLTEPCTAIP
ncbi:MAG TPA: chitobiase/beta-hexosaminidase C-terminal domain-containing protein [Oculatellaceae cyanobacterium]